MLNLIMKVTLKILLIIFVYRGISNLLLSD